MTSPRLPFSRRVPSTHVVALIALILAAIALRFYGLNWDEGRGLHPDERYIIDYVLVGRIGFDWPPNLDSLLNPAISGLNPRSADPVTGEYREFPYGALPVLVTEAAAGLLSWLTARSWNGPDRLHLVGRSLSAILDTVTVLAVFGLGRRVASWRVGLWAAAVALLVPMSIQLAHFFTTDSWLTCFVALALLAAIHAAESGTLRWFAMTGVCCGLAMATKGSVFSLAGVIGAAALYMLLRQRGSEESSGVGITLAFVRLAAAVLAALGAFALFEPYAFLSPGIYIQSLTTQANIVRGVFDVPFTRQYVGTTPVLYQAEHFIRSGFGPVAGLLAIAGIVILAGRFWRERTAAQWILLAWCFGYGLVVAVPETKFLRYLAPLVPALAVMAGVAADAACRWAGRRFAGRGRLVVGGGIMIGLAWWTLAYTSIFAHENPRLAASQWIYANVPSGSALTAEFWDDALPKDLGPGLNAGDRQYQTLTLDLFADAPPVDVADRLFTTLERADFVIVSSNRVPAAVQQLPWRYPVQIEYFTLLENGRLGFDLAAEFSRPPSLAGMAISDANADESFINYDHPTVKIFRKREALSRSTFDQAMAWAVAQPWSPTRDPIRPSLLLDQPVGSLPVVGDARWSSRWTDNSAVAAVSWVALLVLLQVVGWPIARALFGPMVDAGWGVARLLALLIAGYLTWLGASTELFAFRAIGAWIAMALVGGICWLAMWRARQRHDSIPRPPDARRFGIAAESVFWLVFGFFLLLRYLNPDSWHPLWGGEKPMEFAHLNATLRSAHFPPYDPWFADGYLNYYYYGLYLVAFCLKLTGIPSEIGFNLAQPTIIALLASASFTLASTFGRAITKRATLGLMAGACGVLLTVGIGNLVAARQLFQAGRPPIDSFIAWTWMPSRAISNAITEFPYFTALYADLHAHIVALPITVAAITVGYVLAVDAAGCVAVLSGAATRATRWRLAGRLALMSLLLGTLSATNAWDVPIYAAIAIVAIWLATRSIGSPGRRYSAAAAGAGAIALGAYLLFLPFHRHYVALFGSLERVHDVTPFSEWADHLGGLMVIAALGLLAMLFPPRATSISIARSVIVSVAGIGFGFVLILMRDKLEPGVAGSDERLTVVLVATLLGIASWRSLAARTEPESLWRALSLAQLLPISLVVLTDRLVFATFTAVALAAVVIWFTAIDLTVRFVSMLLIGACAVGAGTELVVIADDLINTEAYRMNTIFKFYNQIWVLLALTGAAMVAKLADMAFPRRVPDAAPAAFATRSDASLALSDSGSASPVSGRVGFAGIGLSLTGAIVLLSLVYPVLATLPRLEQRFVDHLGSGTLNGLDWMESATLPIVGGATATDLSFAGDRAVIDWLNHHVDGSPVVAEASIGPYRCNGSRISIGTGLPTIIGWERHEQQQRYPDQLPQRVDDVRRLYASTDLNEKVAILRRYNVEYVVVGPLERLGIEANRNDCIVSNQSEGTEAFSSMVGTTLAIAFESNDTVLYRVLPPGAAS